MSEPLIATYRDIQVILLEDENKWRFVVNGRERTAPSLPKAREYIDNALDKVNTKKEKPWEPFQAYKEVGYRSEAYETVTVTSVAEKGKWQSKTQFWIKSERSGREKVDGEKLYVINDANAARIARIKELDDESNRIDKLIGDIRQEMEQVKVPVEDAETTPTTR